MWFHWQYLTETEKTKIIGLLRSYGCTAETHGWDHDKLIEHLQDHQFYPELVDCDLPS